MSEFTKTETRGSKTLSGRSIGRKLVHFQENQQQGKAGIEKNKD